MENNNNNSQLSTLNSQFKRVPKLRFKEFSGEWEENKLEKFCHKIASGKSKQSDDGSYNLYGSTGIIGVTNEYSNDGKYILIARVGANAGLTNVVEGQFGVTDNTLVVDLRNTVDTDFVLYLLHKYNLNRLIFGSGQPLITGGQLKSLKLKFPSKQEQQKIASFLTSVDKRIENLQLKIDNLKLYKKGIMQKIFSQEIRFKAYDGSEFPEWVEKRLGDVSNITTGKSNRADSGVGGKYTFFDRSMDIRTSDIYLFDKEVVIIAGEGSEFPPKYFKGKFDLHQRTYAIMDFQQTIAKYIYFYLDHYKDYFVSYAVGSTVKSLRLPIFQKMNIEIPCLEEQTKIANFLSAIDSKIEQVTKQLEHTKEFKKGLLQQMFV